MSGSAKGSEGGASGSKGSDSAKGYVSASGKERTLRTGAHPSMGSGKKMGKKVCILESACAESCSATFLCLTHTRINVLLLVILPRSSPGRLQ